MEENFKRLLEDFKNYLISVNKTVKYVDYVRSIYNKSPQTVTDWLKKAVNMKQENGNDLPQDPIEFLLRCFDGHFANTTTISEKTKVNYRVGLKWLGRYVCGFNISSVNIQGINDFDFLACQLVASSAIFCTREVFEAVKSGKCGSGKYRGKNDYGSWYNCKFKRARVKELPNEKKEDVILDNNSRANFAIKQAVIEGLQKYGIHARKRQIFEGFEACHIWPDSCYEAEYHTSVANLVLIPREIAGLTDHCDAVVELLKYEAWKRFGFKIGNDEPQRPDNYKKLTWRNPEKNPYRKA
ncbi:MAG: hypothetical protein IKY76_05240 [Alistipes sp.]|nr:hypothetical protein [Alistipes sp.]